MQTFNFTLDANNYANGAGRSSALDDFNIRVFAPDTAGTYDVIVFSHGLGATLSAGSELAEYWTDRGFMVIAPAHADSADSNYSPGQVGSTARDRWEFRADDVRIALDIAEDFSATGGGKSFSGYQFDMSTPVVSGHSFGASITSVVAGAQPTFDGVTYDWSDPRVEAVINLSGPGPNDEDNFNPGAWNSITVPFLRVSGTYDFANDSQDAGDRLEPGFSATGTTDVHAVYIKDATHSSLFSTNRGGEAEFQETADVTVDFLEAYVNGSSSALSALQAVDVNPSQLGTNASETLNGTNGDDVLFGRAGNDTVNGGAGDDELFGSGGTDVLNGGNGDDILNGGAGVDTLRGGAGDDIYADLFLEDVLTELAGDGTDTIMVAVSATLATNFENLMLVDGAIDGTGNSAANVITGSDGVNELSGLGGNDTLDGGAGNDILRGGSGADYLIGGAGRDVLYGDSGNDVFVFTDIGDSGTTSATRDQIMDFDDSGNDKIDLSAIDANLGAAGDQAFDYIGTSGFSGSGGEVRIRKPFFSSKVQVMIDQDGDQAADMIIDLVSTSLGAVSESDFLL